MNPREPIDLLIVGGINGAGIAHDAGRGLSRRPAASWSTAGSVSRALSVPAVRAVLGERELLLRAAPRIIRPPRFVLPHDRRQRPVWLIRRGLLLYDSLSGRQRCRQRTRSIARAIRPGERSGGFPRGFAFADCWVDDARLVVLNALDAAERGAEIPDARPGSTISCAKNGRDREDVPFRRSMLGLHVGAQTRAWLDAWLARRRAGDSRSADLRADLGTR